MLKITYNIDTQKAELKISGNDFTEYVDWFRANRIPFDKKRKVYKCSALQAFSAIEFAENMNDEVDILPAVASYMRENIFGKPEVKYFRNFRVDENLLKLPPLKGLPPFENFQVDNIEKCLKKNCHALFEPMGVGKSYMIINTINHLYKRGRCDRFYILVPTVALINTYREILKFSNLFVKEDIEILSTNNRYPFEKDPKIVISTLRSFKMISDEAYKNQNKGVLKDYRKPPFDFSGWGSNRCMVIDESHMIKNKKAKATKIVLMHKKYFCHRYVMTGTPAPKDFLDVYPQMKFLDSSLVPEFFEEFKNDVAKIEMKAFRGRKPVPVIVGFSQERKKWYEERFSKYISRHRQEDLIQLPDMIVKRDLIKLEGKQRKIYQEIITEQLEMIKEEYGSIVPYQVKNKMPYMRMALDNPNIIDPENIISDNLKKQVIKFSIQNHCKLPALQELVDSYLMNGEKVTIFDYHPKTIEQLAGVFKKYNPVVIHGESGSKESISKHEWREKELDRFRKDKDCNLLLASQKILSVATNLQECHVAIYFSRDDNFVDWEQSKKRFHRNGQLHKVVIHTLVFADTLDERTDMNLEGKKNLNDKIFMRESLGKEEWKDFFEGEL